MSNSPLDKLELIGDILRAKEAEYIKKYNRDPKDEWYSSEFDMLYEKSYTNLKLLYSFKNKDDR